MRQAALRLWNFLGRLADKRPPSSRVASRRRPSVRLELLSLEDRITPSASTLGTVSGAVVVGGAVNPSQFFSLQGIEVTLTGTSNQGDAVDMNATTDSSGTFAFRSVEAGNYELTALPDATLVRGGEAGVTVVAGQSTTQDVTVGALATGSLTLRDFLNTPSQDGFNLPTAGPTSDNPPVVSSPISNVVVASGGSTTIDLAANFSDPDTTNSQVVFDTSDGAMTVNLDDAAAPQTVANFLDYVENSRYSDTIFHRLDTNPPVLQGGGFGLQTNSSGDVTGFPGVANANDPLLANEFSSSLPDTLGTLAMAKLGGNPNSATSQFFFNLADNSTTLGNSNNGGFAVFGSVASDPTSQAVFQALQATPVQDESEFNSAFNVLPLNSSANLTNFPTNTTPSNYLTINDVQVVKQDESLTYSVVGNSNPSLVNVSFVAGHPEVLSVNPVGQSGTATITVQATDDFGLSVQTSFQVTVEPLAITSVTNPINDSNLTTTTASGIAAAGDSISVTATDGTNNTSPVTVTAAANGTWTSPAINVSTLTNGTITYTATTTDAAGNTLTASKTSTKNTGAPTVAISSSTNPVNIANEANAAVSGTATAGASISVTATDNTTTTPAVTTTAATDGTWTVNLNVSSLADGTITYDVVATNAAGNTAATHTTATKDTVAVVSVTSPINAANQTTTSASGTTEVGATVTVTATDGTTTTAPVTATVDGSGNWTATGIDVSSLKDGAITYTATATDTASNTATATKTATKDTVPPAISVATVTNPITSGNETTTSASGTTEVGATVRVTATDGTTTTAPVTATVDGSGNWTAAPIDVSSLMDGTITYTATATDAAGNTNTASLTATKGT